MAKSNIFNQASGVLQGRKYYHGTHIELLDDYLKPKKNFNSVQNGTVSAAFVTSSEAFAKFFAINHCIGMGHATSDHNKIYLEQLSKDIIPVFYVYIVYETPDNKFVHDCGTEYYSTKPIRIVHRKKFDTVKEIERLGYEIYVLNEPLKNKTNKESDNNFAVQQEMQERIKNKQYHRVDIAGIVQQQSKKNIIKTTVNESLYQKNN